MNEVHFTLKAVVIAIVILLSFWLIAKVAVVIIKRFADKAPSQKQPVFYLLMTTAKIVILIIGVITALGSAGVNVSAMVASLGLSGLAITIASKDAFANMLGGIVVLLHQPFKIGDIIQINKLKGEVSMMSLRFTHLKSDGKEILIPNSSLLTNNIIIHHQEKRQVS